VTGVLATSAACLLLIAVTAALVVRGLRSGDRPGDAGVSVATTVALDGEGWLVKRIELTARNPARSPGFLTARVRYQSVGRRAKRGASPHPHDPPVAALLDPRAECTLALPLTPAVRALVQFTVTSGDGRHLRRSVHIPVTPLERSLRAGAVSPVRRRHELVRRERPWTDRGR
jgi:hypothetical protein